MYLRIFVLKVKEALVENQSSTIGRFSGIRKVLFPLKGNIVWQYSYVLVQNQESVVKKFT